GALRHHVSTAHRQVAARRRNVPGRAGPRVRTVQKPRCFMQSWYAVLKAGSLMPLSDIPRSPASALAVAPVESLATAPVPSRTPPDRAGVRPVPVIIGPVLSAVPPDRTPAVVSGVPEGVVIEGPVGPPADGEALGFEPVPRAARLQASKSACVGSAADTPATSAKMLPATSNTVANVFMVRPPASHHQGACRRVDAQGLPSAHRIPPSRCARKRSSAHTAGSWPSAV